MVVLPLSFANDSGLPESLVDMVLYFNHDKIPETVSPRNGYTVIPTVYTDLQLTGIAFQPKGRASMAGGIGDIHPVTIDLSTQPGTVSVATDRIHFVQGKRSEGGSYSYFFNWSKVSTGWLAHDELLNKLRSDGNAKVWKFQEETQPKE